ncbi:MAG: hypothetical protein KGH49_04045 [Candidatus Micrarchaeota archaeon]|nr:hypothetical protein [Candidatus Micrarchaeota archaeon]
MAKEQEAKELKATILDILKDARHKSVSALDYPSSKRFIFKVLERKGLMQRIGDNEFSTSYKTTEGGTKTSSIAKAAEEIVKLHRA